jgi:replicative DNA helicase
MSDAGELKPEYFTNLDIAAGYSALLSLANDGGGKVDFPSLSAWREADGKASSTVRALESLTPDQEMTRVYVQAIIKGARRRQISVAASLMSGEPDDELHAEALERAREIGVGAKAILTSADAVSGFLEVLQRRVGGEDPATSTGLIDLDRTLAGGFRGGQVIVLAARPGVGKSALAQGIAEHVASSESGKTALFISLEMSPQEIMERRVVAATKGVVSMESLRLGQLTEEQFIEIERVTHELSGSRMEFLASSSESIEGIIATIRARAKKGDIGLVVLDYLQLIESAGKSDNREQQVAKVSRCVKQMALSLQIPVLLLSQLNRDGEKGAVKRKPKMSDLRESGSIEQDADIVLFIHDDTPDDARGVVPVTEKTIVVAKQRAGRCCDVPVAWIGQECRFANLGRDADSQSAQGARHVKLKPAFKSKAAGSSRPLAATSSGANIQRIRQMAKAGKGQFDGLPEDLVKEFRDAPCDTATAVASPFDDF